MAKYLLSEELVKKLNENPCVESASPFSVTFTSDFKQKAYDEYIGGKSIKQIFAEAGLDEKELGTKRLENFQSCIMRRSGEESGFDDKRKNRDLQSPESTQAQLMKQVRELQHRVAYLEQENEFLKKIQKLEKDYGTKAGKLK